MKRNRAYAALLAAVVVGAPIPAVATDVPKGKGVEAPAASAPLQEGPTPGLQAGTTRNTLVEEPGGLIDRATGKAGKFWDIGATWETHALLWQTNTGNAGCRYCNRLGLSFSLALTKRDRLRLGWGLFERAVADMGESGLRASDIGLSYSHSFKLPWSVGLRVGGSLSAPTSFYSQLATLITTPSVSATVSRTFFGALSVDISAFGAYQITRSNTYLNADGTSSGQANTWLVTGASINLEYALHWFPALTLGIDGGTYYSRKYDVGGDATSLPGVWQNNQSMTMYAPKTMGQPVGQSYCGEVFVRYTPPKFYGVGTDITLAFADGDPSIGCVARVMDGISHFFLDYYSNLEVYGAVSLRY